MNKSELILSTINSAGYEAYYVGGCVRDMLMGKAPHDTDITTNALPQEIMRIFPDYHVIPTGLKHGTVTVLLGGEPFEITTYRIDGEYSDSRRPDSVSFTRSLSDDLARRDFTMNAVAMDINGNITDPFHGADDIKNKIIRCVGEPEKRFTEDALRIMRCLRFSSQLGFKIDEKTASAVHGLKNRLECVSRERIGSELDKLLCGWNCIDIMLNFSDAIAEIIPEIKPCIGFKQFTPYHRYDVWEHTVRAVDAAPFDSVLLRRTLLFHDLGKPHCFSRDENGVGHFKGHAKISSEITGKIMHRLKYDNRSIRDTLQLIERHSDKIQSEKQIKRLISSMGEKLFFDLIKMKKADNSAKNPFVLKELEELDKIVLTARKIISENSCMKLSQLAVNGRDIAALGFSGREIGEILGKLLSLVIDGELSNEREILLNYAEKSENK